MSQELVRVTRVSKTEYRSEDIADVRFVPLIGEEGWTGEDRRAERAGRRLLRRVPGDEELLVQKLADGAEPFRSIDAADLDPLLERIGSCRVVLLAKLPMERPSSTGCGRALPAT